MIYVIEYCVHGKISNTFVIDNDYGLNVNKSVVNCHSLITRKKDQSCEALTKFYKWPKSLR